MDTSSKYVVIAKVGAPHGVKGWVKINSFTQPATNILNYHPWLVKTKNSWQVMPVAETKQHGNNVVARIEGCDDREQAKKYTHAEIAIEEAQLPELEPGEYYWRDLIGLQVKTVEGLVLGNITQMLETGSNDVMVVEGNKTLAIPFILDEVIVKVDLSHKLLTVNWDHEF